MAVERSVLRCLASLSLNPSPRSEPGLGDPQKRGDAYNPSMSECPDTPEARARAILQAIRAVPAGQVAGYGEIARRAGLPGRARLVAQVLRKYGAPDLPWFRVLRSDGRIAFPEGSSGYREQCQRLRAEGVGVVKGRVIGRQAVASVDEQVWGPG
jgi:methylated-DNA-protein-cysteine methyltransferase-like protein